VAVSPNSKRSNKQASELARLDSWLIEIVEQARGAGREQSNGDWRFGASDGFVLHRNGFWHDFVAGRGGHGALSLLAHLGGDPEIWLARVGDGRLGRCDGFADAAEQSLADIEATAFVEALWSRACPIADSPTALQYFANRGLDPAVGADLRWLDNQRGDEGAVVTHVSGLAGETVAVQLTHIKPDGTKSDIQPVRKLLRGPHDWRRRGAFRLGSAGAEVVMVEGVEDAIAAMMAGALRVHACLGVAGIGRAELPLDVSMAVVARDDDPPGSPASLQLGRGLARILLQGRSAKVTARAGTFVQGAKDIADLDNEAAQRMLAGADLPKDRLDAAEKDAFLDEVAFATDDVYENCRSDIAKALGWRVVKLDDSRAKRIKARVQDGAVDDGLPGQPLTFDEIEPWPEAVDGAALLDELAKTTRAYVVINRHQCDATALWGVFAHAHDLRYFAPLLIAKSAIKRSGKSRLAEVLERLVPRPLYIAGLTAAFIERAIESSRCTLLIDEADRLRSDPMVADRVAAQLNRSFKRRSARTGKNVPLPGGGHTPRLFSTWAPTFIAGIGAQADTAEDRAVILVLKRKLVSEKTKQLRDADGADLVVLGRKVARWVADHENELRQYDSTVSPLDVDNDRAKDVWDPLLAIADTVGGEWPKRARAAGKALVAAAEEEDLKIMLLGDIRAIFRAAFPPDDPKHQEAPENDEARSSGRYGPRMTSKELVGELLKLEDQPCGAFGKGQKPLTQNVLAYTLREFGVRPGNIRLKSAVLKGYYLRTLEDAFSRYLPYDPASEPPQRYNAENSWSERVADGLNVADVPFSEKDPLQRRTATSEGDPLHFEKPLHGQPSNSGRCSDVADENPTCGGLEDSSTDRAGENEPAPADDPLTRADSEIGETEETDESAQRLPRPGRGRARR
jgi:putative DNA primase/helicase